LRACALGESDAPSLPLQPQPQTIRISRRNG